MTQSSTSTTGTFSSSLVQGELPAKSKNSNFKADTKVDDSYMQSSLKATQSWPRRYCLLFRKNPSTVIVPLMVLVTLVASGLAVAFTIRNSDQEVQRNEAKVLAVSTGKSFASQLDRALLPIFSLAQFVSEVDAFNELPDLIGPSLGVDSLPFTDSTHRNVSGVCNDPALVNRFNRIAETIKRNAGMDGILMNLQLAPEAVVCLIHPLNNTEDFEEGVFLDSTPSIGHDLLYDPARSIIAEQTIPADDMVIAGPLQLAQCRDVDCAPTVREALIARLPIYSPTHTITVNGRAYKRWGFAVGLINWNELLVRSGVYDVFEEQGMEFQLTRTDRIAKDDNVFTEKVRWSLQPNK